MPVMPEMRLPDCTEINAYVLTERNQLTFIVLTEYNRNIETRVKRAT